MLFWDIVGNIAWNVNAQQHGYRPYIHDERYFRAAKLAAPQGWQARRDYRQAYGEFYSP